MSESTKYFKVLADGAQVPADDPRTDHVAVLDTTRNLLIHPHSIGVDGETAPRDRLLAAIAELDVLGGGWRLATREETESILDLSRHNPAVDAALFPGIRTDDWHVTSTPAAWAPASLAWWVFFDGGFVDDVYVVFGGWALAVRPAGQ
jgi:hypothetical protein